MLLKAANRILCAGLVSSAATLIAHAHDPVQLEEVEVIERSDELLGIATTATEGTVGARQIENRPLLRTGEILETVPGVIITQHSGAGKANQYFLRGFNLDHGTDFASWVDGMPVNMPTHGHGQGYSDLNFVIPELVRGIDYRKGPYYAAEGDFSSAGAAHFDYFDKLDEARADVTLGTYNYYRGLFAGSTALGSGTLLGAVDVTYDDGPWEREQNFEKYNGMLRYSQGDQRNGFNLTAMAYHGEWDSTDQVPKRAVDQGLISSLGTIDQTDGGESHRYSLSGGWRRGDDKTATHVNAYFIDYKLDLFSNFTYLLDDPVNGDQFEQVDRRQVYGGKAHHHWFANFLGFDMENTVGLQLRFDDIDQVGLFRTTKRRRLDTVRRDSVHQLSLSPYIENRTQWLPWLRSVAGVRGDAYHFDVDSDNPANSGSASAGIGSPKLSVIFGPWADTEYYASVGYGFHSNDGRGATTRIDPGTGLRTDTVNALVQSRGAEVGVRSAFIPNLQTTLSLFLLDIDSELLFIGDAGNTEASRPSRRLGIEWTNYYAPFDWLIFDADFSFSQARFKDNDPAGDRIPGAIESVIAAGVTIDDIKGFFGSARVRHFGSRPLIEDNSVRSEDTTLVNLDVGYKIDQRWRITMGIFNLLDAGGHDIDYFYTSRLAGEPAGGVDDLHYHPVEPRQFRFMISGRF